MKILFFLLISASFPAFANPCQGDIQKYCAQVNAGMGKVTKCLLENKDKLTPACKKEVTDPMSTSNWQNPCQKDLVDFCADMPLRGEKLSYCLLKNETKLGRSCANDFKEKKEKFLQSNPCAPDITEHCYAEVKGKRSDLARCLIKNKSKFSKVCQKNVEELTSKVRRQNSCFDEIEKYCSNAEGPEQIQACLEKNKKSLGPKCVVAVEKQAEKIKSHPCHGDLERLCKTALTPENKRKCLQTYESKLSPSCKSFQEKQKERMGSIVGACEADRKKFCSNIPRRSKRVMECLKQNDKKISLACQNALK